MQFWQNWPFQVIQSHFGAKGLEKLQITQNPTFLGVGGGGGGIHQPEPQGHVDQKFQLNLRNGGFLFSVFHKLEMYVCSELGGGATAVEP